MDLDKYKNNIKTKYLAQGIEHLSPEQQKDLIEQMDLILEGDKEEGKSPKVIVLEVRAGAGGDEASLFAFELAEMYRRYAEIKGWGWKTLYESKNDTGGYKEANFEIKAKGAYEALKYESGVHRVQRIPATEKQGRIHTSTASVVVIPMFEQTNIEVPDSDLDVEFTKGGGKGGQAVNKIESAVRITHKPTGESVRVTTDRSQVKNREIAMKMILSRLQELEDAKNAEAEQGDRKAQVGTMDRSEKIRTYNFPQDRLTDHRIKKNWSNLPSIMSGNLDPIIEAFKDDIE